MTCHHVPAVPVLARGLCGPCYRAERRERLLNEQCHRCDRPALASGGLCYACYDRAWRRANPELAAAADYRSNARRRERYAREREERRG